MLFDILFVALGVYMLYQLLNAWLIVNEIKREIENEQNRLKREKIRRWKEKMNKSTKLLYQWIKPESEKNSTNG